MKRMTTKMSTVTPMSTLTKSKPVGQGVKNMGKGKGSKPMSMGIKTAKKAGYEGAMEAASNMPRIGMSTTVKRKNVGMPSIGMERTSEPMFAIGRKAVKTGTISPVKPKAKAKMLPEVKVTAPKPQKRLALKVTSRRMK